jgi:hypothetical protein
LNRTDVEIVEIGGDGDYPGLCGQLGEKITSIQGKSLEIGLQTPVLILLGCAFSAQSLEIVGVQGEGNLLVPGVGALLPDDKSVSCGTVQLIEQGAYPVEHGLQCVDGVGTALLLTPQKIRQLLLRDGAVAQ